MAIPNSQLETWTSLGSVAQSRDTYASVARVLESPDAPYHNRDFDVFLQGSYKNNTNIYGDSDVDIVIRQKSCFYYNIDKLSDAEKSEFRRVHHNPAEYTLVDFKREVAAWLAYNYKADFDDKGGKALYIKARDNRRNADVLVAAQHKVFSAYPNSANQVFMEGVMFLPKSGGSTVNYPKQHKRNLTAKHQETKEWLKPTVRAFKNMRNRAVEEGLLREGVAPSYYIEGLLFNAPLGAFNTDMQTTVASCLSWAVATDRSKLPCGNYYHWLVRDNEKTSWPVADCDAYLDAMVKLWGGWGRPQRF